MTNPKSTNQVLLEAAFAKRVRIAHGWPEGRDTDRECSEAEQIQFRDFSDGWSAAIASAQDQVQAELGVKRVCDRCGATHAPHQNTLCPL